MVLVPWGTRAHRSESLLNFRQIWDGLYLSVFLCAFDRLWQAAEGSKGQSTPHWRPKSSRDSNLSDEDSTNLFPSDRTGSSHMSRWSIFIRTGSCVTRSLQDRRGMNFSFLVQSEIASSRLGVRPHHAWVWGVQKISVVWFNLRDGGKEEARVKLFIRTPSSDSQKEKKTAFPLFSVTDTERSTFTQ